jgi:hypothetical protein
VLAGAGFLENVEIRGGGKKKKGNYQILIP